MTNFTSKFLVADATDFVDSKDVQGCVDFFTTNEMTVFRTSSLDGSFMVVSSGMDDGFDVGDTFVTLDNSTFETTKHTVMTKQFVKDGQVVSHSGMVMKPVDFVVTFK